MDNFTAEGLTPSELKKQRLTRILLLIWLALGLVVAAILCYVLTAAFRPPPAVPVLVGDIDEYPINTFNIEYINGSFFDETSNKVLDTIPLMVERGADGRFTVFLARSTRPDEAILVPKQCIVNWDEGLQRFLELCGGSQWTRDGKYAAGPAPRDLDRFPAHVDNGQLLIDMTLIKGAAHP
jgi:hypothetical protein